MPNFTSELTARKEICNVALAEIIEAIQKKPEADRTESEKITLKAFEEAIQRGKEMLAPKE